MPNPYQGKPPMCECGHPLYYHTLLYPPTAPGSCVKSEGGKRWLWQAGTVSECDCRGFREDDTKPWAVDDDHVRIKVER